MRIIRTVNELRQAVSEARSQGQSVGLVPTMGALHQGHISLVDRCRAENDMVVVSVFVNPTQFNDATDLEKYPRTEQADCQLLEQAGVDVAFIPSVAEMYPEPDTRQFDLGAVAEVMEGPTRPGHFNGVAQVVSKLFEMAHPTRAYFGEKDFQQIAVIRRMVDLCGGFDGLEIVPCPICREPSGLARSSRNTRLSDEMRNIVAPQIYAALRYGLKQKEAGASVADVKSAVTGFIAGVPGLETEYFEIVDGITMQPVADWSEADTIQGCITVHCAPVRLIDNIKFK